MARYHKTVAVTLRFLVSDLRVSARRRDRKACYDFGFAILEGNESKGIRRMNQPFNCFEDIIPLIKELFRKNRVLVVSGNRRPRVLSHRRRTE